MTKAFNQAEIDEMKKIVVSAMIFGPFFFLARGLWKHALIWVGLVIATSGISWPLYAFAAPFIVRAQEGKPILSQNVLDAVKQYQRPVNKSAFPSTRMSSTVMHDENNEVEFERLPMGQNEAELEHIPIEEYLPQKVDKGVERLKQLDDLRKQGVIQEGDYQMLKRQITG